MVDFLTNSLRGVPVLLVVASFLAAPMLRAESPASLVSVDTNRRTYVLGDVVEIVVDNKAGEKVFLPGCQTYQVERFGDERYQPLEGEHCISEGDARAIDPGQFTLQFQPKLEHIGRPLRISLVYGIAVPNNGRCRRPGVEISGRSIRLLSACVRPLRSSRSCAAAL